MAIYNLWQLYFEYYSCVTLYSYASYLRRSGWGHKSQTIFSYSVTTSPTLYYSLPVFLYRRSLFTAALVSLFVPVTTFIFFALSLSRFLASFDTEGVEELLLGSEENCPATYDNSYEISQPRES